MTSWASSAHDEFLATNNIREVSGCLAFIGMNAKFMSFTFVVINYLADSNRLHEKVVLLL